MFGVFFNKCAVCLLRVGVVLKEYINALCGLVVMMRDKSPLEEGEVEEDLTLPGWFDEGDAVKVTPDGKSSTSPKKLKKVRA